MSEKKEKFNFTAEDGIKASLLMIVSPATGLAVAASRVAELTGLGKDYVKKTVKEIKKEAPKLTRKQIEVYKAMIEANVVVLNPILTGPPFLLSPTEIKVFTDKCVSESMQYLKDMYDTMDSKEFKKALADGGASVAAQAAVAALKAMPGFPAMYIPLVAIYIENIMKVQAKIAYKAVKTVSKVKDKYDNL